MNRIDRLTAILIQLQGKKIVKAAEIADRFQISLRTVYRDVKALQESGVPIGAEAGTGYYIVEGYHLPPVMFSKEEAAALLTGEKLMEQFSDQSNKKQFGNAMQKIRSVLRGSEKDYLETLDENIAVFRRERPVREGFPDRFLSDIQLALASQQVVKMDYYSFSNEEATNREVEPIGVFYLNSAWHMIAWCRMRKGYRDFRLDRIKQCRTLDISFDKSKHMTLQQYMQQQQQHNPAQPHVVKVFFSASVARYIQESKYYYGLVSEQNNGDKTEMTFLQESLEYMGRWLLMFGNQVTVTAPEELKTIIKDLVQELHHHYQ